MATRNSKSGVVVDFASAKRKILRKRAASARAAFDPFDTPLLKAWAAKVDAGSLAIYRAHLSGDTSRLTTQQLAASIRRDMVRQAARAAL